MRGSDASSSARMKTLADVALICFVIIMERLAELRAGLY